MIALNRKTDYALVALTTLAAASPEGMSARELSERTRLPLPALRNILKQLGYHGLLVSDRGVRGGYRLSRDAGAITIAMVVEAIEGPVRFAPCCPASVTGGDPCGCPLEGSCQIKGAVRHLHGRILDFLREVTISDLRDQTRRADAEHERVVFDGPAVASAGRSSLE